MACCEPEHTAGMVIMLVGNDDAGQLPGLQTQPGQTHLRFAQAEATVK
jgi:hypothetical protein